MVRAASLSWRVELQQVTCEKLQLVDMQMCNRQGPKKVGNTMMNMKTQGRRRIQCSCLSGCVNIFFDGKCKQDNSKTH